VVIQMTTFTPLIAASAPRHTALLLFAPQEQKEGGQKVKVQMTPSFSSCFLQEEKEGVI
jgi:hypothetical protein